MPEFGVNKEEINLFRLRDTYVFNHYFKGEEIFSELRDFYNRNEYRFEVKEDELEKVQEILEENFYETNIVKDLEPYFVVKEKYTKHSNILKSSVLNITRGNYHIFLMKDKLSEEQAIEEGAEKLEDIDMEFKPPKI